MAIYDIIMLVVFAGAIWFGYWKGLAWQIASLAAIIVSYIVASNFHNQVSGFIQVQAPWNHIGAMLVLFLGTSLVIWTIYATISKSLKKNELKGFDRQIGALLGAAKGALLCMVITMFATTYSEKAHKAVHTSLLGPHIENGIWTASDFVPSEIAQFVDPHIKKWKDKIQHGENEVNLKKSINNLTNGHGSTYQLEQPFNQNVSQVPNQPQNQDQTSYQGQWQPPNTQVQYGTNYGSQPQTNPPSNGSSWPSTGGATQTAQNTISELDVASLAKQLWQAAQQEQLEIGWEAIENEARRRLKEAIQNPQR